MANVDIPTIYGIHLSQWNSLVRSEDRFLTPTFALWPEQCTSFFLATLPLVLLESMGFAVRQTLGQAKGCVYGTRAQKTDQFEPFLAR